MKVLLHTSDWHVGKTIRGRSRADEHEAVLAEIVGIADAEAVDLVLVAGDLFDSAAPPPDAEQIVYRTLLELARGGERPVVVIAGNHDNARRFAAVAPLLAGVGVHVVPMLTGPADGGVIDVEVGGQTDAARGGAVRQRSATSSPPPTSWASMPTSTPRPTPSACAAPSSALTAGFGDDTVNLLVAHGLVVGGLAGRRRAHRPPLRRLQRPGHGLPPRPHYVALGPPAPPAVHARALPAMHYCGSPLQLDFGETSDDKAGARRRPGAGAPGRGGARRPLEAGRRLRTLEGSLTALQALVGTTGDDHLRVRVDEPARPGLADEVRELFPDAVDVAIVRPEVERRERAERAGKSPQELFDVYLAERDESDPELSALFAELLEQVTD